ncbi:hypothetical protein VE04_02504 [Pseudogymnoascus sp. 24MN13]|nr:hypothetical protein VE04_02504 [Pseudogymnoascus sp. 24MN13]
MPIEGADGAIFQSPSLLTLPPEVRCMIWETVATCSGPILVCADSLTFGPLEQVAKFSFAIPPPVLTNKQRKLRSSKAKAKLTANPLIWLLTNRQIYAEARPVFYANLCLAFDNVFCLSAFMFQSPETFIKPSMVRSLSLDLQLAIDADTRNKFIPPFSNHCKFSFARSVNHGWEIMMRNPDDWWGRRYICKCPFCLAPSRSALANGAEYFTGLRELQLQIRFGCSHGPANEWQMIRQCCDPQRFRTGGQHFGKLGQLMDSDSLVCKDNSGKIADFAKWICTQVPLRVFSKLKLDAVDVQFNVERIERSPLVTHEYQRGNDKCWCDSHKVDKESIESCGFAEELKRRLMNGDSEEDG